MEHSPDVGMHLKYHEPEKKHYIYPRNETESEPGSVEYGYIYVHRKDISNNRKKAEKTERGPATSFKRSNESCSKGIHHGRSLCRRRGR
jgi:hypothetical protein